MADYEESYFLKYLFLYLSDSSLPAIFLLTPVPARPTDKRLMDKHAVDKHRLDSAIRNDRLPREYIPRRSPITKPSDNPPPRRYDKNINTPPTVTAG